MKAAAAGQCPDRRPRWRPQQAVEAWRPGRGRLCCLQMPWERVLLSPEAAEAWAAWQLQGGWGCASKGQQRDAIIPSLSIARGTVHMQRSLLTAFSAPPQYSMGTSRHVMYTSSKQKDVQDLLATSASHQQPLSWRGHWHLAWREPRMGQRRRPWASQSRWRLETCPGSRAGCCPASSILHSAASQLMQPAPSFIITI